MGKGSSIRPNVLLIYTDQQRLDTIRAYGAEYAITPNIDSLANEGAVFDKCFVQSPVCGPSRVSCLTGRYCGSTGVGDNGISFPNGLTPINKLLKPYNYHTAQIGKLHFNPHVKRNHKNPTDTYGFDVFMLSDEPGCYEDAYIKWVEEVDKDELQAVYSSLPPAAHRYNQKELGSKPRQTHEPYIFGSKKKVSHTDYVTYEINSYIESRQDSNNPFFVIAGMYAPHTPVNPPKKWVDRYKDVVFPKTNKSISENIPKGVVIDNLSEEEWQEVKRYYMALVSHVDECVGEIIDKLKECNLYDNTMIIFTADHGEYLGDHHQVQKGMPGHDCISNVPLIISCPNKIKHKRISNLVEAIDIVPTILDYCVIQTPTFVEGESLRGLIEGTTDKHKDCILTEHFEPNGLKQTTIRTDKFKYYINSNGFEVLFDLEKDKNELDNRINEDVYKDEISELRKMMILKLQQHYPNLEKEAEY